MRRASLSIGAVAVALAGADFLVRLLVALRPIEFIDGWTIPDDAYISLTIARSIAHGLGPFFGLAHTNGFQPLYVFLISPAFRLFPGNPEAPIHTALVMLSLFDAAALYVVCRILMRSVRSPIPLLLLGAVWVFNPTSVKHTVNGLETSISLFFAASVILAFARLESSETREQEKRRLFVLGLVGGLAILARIDNLLLLGALAALHVLRKFLVVSSPGVPRATSSGSGRPIRDCALGLALAGGAALLVNLPWLIYSLHYTGEIFPISGRAVRYHSLSYVDHAPTWANYYYPNLRRSAGILLNGNRAAIAGGILFAILLAARNGRHGIGEAWSVIRRYRLPWLYALLLILAYALYIFTPWYFPRYYLPAIIPFALTFAGIADLFLSRISDGRSRRAMAGVALALLVGVNAGQAEFRSFYTNRDSLTAGYMNLGLWARSRFPDGTRIGSMQSGAIAYFAPNLTIVNLDGVVNRDCYHALLKKEAMAYIRGERIEYFIAWLENFETLMKETRSFRDDDMILISRVDGFGSWRHNWYLYKVNYRAEIP